MADKDVKVVLDKALEDGTITQEQYRKMISESVPESRERGRDRMQTVLIAAGVTIMVAVGGFAVLMSWKDMEYNVKVGLLSLLATCMFMGAALARNMKYDKLHFGLLAGASNLIVLAYGYWFYYEARIHESYSGDTWESIVPANRALALGIPLIIVPAIILCYLIYKNSRLGSQGALLSLIWGCWAFFFRAAYDRSDSFENGFLIIGITGLAILMCSVAVNIQWMRGRLAAWKEFYMERIRTFNSLISSGFVLGSFYILFAPVMFGDYGDGIINGAIYMIFPAFAAILYGIDREKEGLVMSACGIIILATWIAGLGFGGGSLCILPLAIMTALMLIGIAFLLRRLPKTGPESPDETVQTPSEGDKDGQEICIDNTENR